MKFCVEFNQLRLDKLIKKDNFVALIFQSEQLCMFSWICIINTFKEENKSQNHIANKETSNNNAVRDIILPLHINICIDRNINKERPPQMLLYWMWIE